MQYSKFNLGRVHESLASSRMQRSLHSVQHLFRRSGSDYPRGRSRQDDRTGREWNTRHIQPIHPIPCDSTRMRGCMLLRGSHITRVGYAAIPNAISIVRDENQLAGAERFG